MPKRTTISFTSEDAPDLQEDKLFVYYCKYSGKHAMTTDVDLQSAPRRQSDNATVIDTSKCLCRTYLQDGGVKVIKLPEGKAEKHYRLCVGQLPVAYRTEPNGKLLYVMDGALSTYADDSKKDLASLVPPCIISSGTGGVQVMLEVEERAENSGITGISADSVQLSIQAPLDSVKAKEQIFELMSTALQRRWAQFSLMKGFSPTSKVLMVDNLEPAQAYARLEEAKDKGDAKKGRGAGFGLGGRGRKR
ncbi:unnamed protein product [Pedinophyceae sp. YPF-701]|nr:unnamed protein product [Pedinophyceae sp. YPF-701]